MKPTHNAAGSAALRALGLLQAFFVVTSLAAPAALAQQIAPPSVFVLEAPDEYAADAIPSAAAREQVASQFFEKNSDSYDFLIVFPTFAVPFGLDASGDVAGLHFAVRNDVRGIGLPLFDNGLAYGSPQRLKAYIDVGTLRPGASDASLDAALQTVAHEVAHQWSARVGGALAGRDASHWSFYFDSNASVLYGADWRDNGDGTFTAVDSRRRYADLDLYLMGFLSADEVSPLTVLTPADGVTYGSTDLPPPAGTTIRASATATPLSAYLSALGARQPAASQAQREFRAAFVVLVPRNGAPSAAQLAHVEAVRTAWANKFFFLTRGRAVMETERVDRPLPEFTTRPGVVAGLSYLLNAQKADGCWADAPETAPRDTEAALSALALLDGEGVEAASARGVAFFSGLVTGDTDARARRLRALVLARASDPAARDELVTDPDPLGLRQREGRGYTAGYGATVLDTVLVSLALSEGEATDAVLDEYTEYFLERQNPDGGWPALDRGTSRVEATALVLQFLARRPRTDLVAHAAGAALTYLEAHQGLGGFFHDGDLLPSTTAEVVLAAGAWGMLGSEGSFELAAITESLASRQLEDGSWEESVHQTARALQAMRMLGLPNLGVRASDVVLATASAVEGQNVFADVRVYNNGFTTSAPAQVQAFDSEGRPFGVPVELPSIASRASATVRLTLETLGHGGNSNVFVVVDPAGLVDETREDDNRVALPFPVATAPAGVDLYALTGSVQASPAAISRLPQGLTVSAVVGNAGLTAAGDVLVALEVNGMVVTTRAVQLGTQSSAAVTFPYEVLDGPFPLQVRVVVDPGGVVAESREDNNIAVTAVPVQSTVDLGIEGLSLAPNPVDPGQDVVVTVDVRNRGTATAYSTQAGAKVLAPDGAVVATLPPATLVVPAGGSARATLLWRARLSGALRVVAAVTHPSEVAPGDNAAEAPLTVNASALPNLAVAAAALSTSPPEPLVGQPATALAHVSNTGSAAGPFTVDFFWGNPDAGGVRFDSAAVASLEGGGVVTASVPFTLTSSESRQLVVRVDPAAQVKEFDESDNDSVLTVTPLPIADLVLTDADIALSNSSPRPGDAVAVTASVYNRGRQASASTEVDLYLGAPESGGRLLGTRALAALEPLARASVSFTWTAEGLGAPQTLVAVVNARGTSPEQRADNNRGARQVLVQGGAVTVTERFFSPNGDGVKDSTAAYFQLPEPGPALVRVLDARGAAVRELASAGTDAAFGSVAWDGRDARGRLARDGDYTLVAYAGERGEGAQVGSSLVTLDTNRFPLEEVKDASLVWQSDLTDFYDYSDPYPHQSPMIASKVQAARDDSGVIFYWEPALYGQRELQKPCGFYFRSLLGDEPVLLTPTNWNCTSWTEEPWSLNYGSNERFVVAPDQSAIVYLVETGWQDWTYVRSFAIQSFSLKTKTFSRLVQGGYAYEGQYQPTGFFRFSPDAKQLWFTWGPIRGGGAFGERAESLDLETGERRVLLDFKGEDPSNGILSFEVSPETGRIAYLRGGTWEGPCLWSESLAGGTRTLHGCSPDTSYAWVDGGRQLMYSHRTGEWTDADKRVVELIDVDATEGLPSSEGSARTIRMTEASTPVFSLSVSPSTDALALMPQSGAMQSIPAGNVGVLDLLRGGVPRPLKEVRGAAGTGRSNTELQWSPLGTFLTGRTSGPWKNGSETHQWALVSAANLQARISATRPPGSTALSLRGTAADLNIEGFTVSVRPFGATTEPTVIHQGNRSVVEGSLTLWTPPRPGLYEVVLTVKDLAGNSVRRSTRVAWADVSVIANLRASPRLFSPNGDGKLDTMTVSYEATAPVTTQFRITDGTGHVVRTLDRTHLTAEKASFVWDGRDDSGQPVPDGEYTISAERVATGVGVDTTAPQVRLVYGVDWPSKDGRDLLLLPPMFSASGPYETWPSIGFTYSVSDSNLDRWDLNVVEGGRSHLVHEDFGSIDKESNAFPSAAGFHSIPTKMAYAEWLRAGRVQLTASDLAGNVQQQELPPLEEMLLLWGVGDANDVESGWLDLDGRRLPRVDLLKHVTERALIDGNTSRVVPGGRGRSPNSFSLEPRRYAFAFASTISEPIVSWAVSYPSPLTGGEVVDTANVTMLSEGVITWDARHLPRSDRRLPVTFLATDARGRTHTTSIILEPNASVSACMSHGFPPYEAIERATVKLEVPRELGVLDAISPDARFELWREDGPAEDGSAPELSVPVNLTWDDGDDATRVYSTLVETGGLAGCRYRVVLKARRADGSPVLADEALLSLCGIIPSYQLTAERRLMVAETFRQPVKSIDVFLRRDAASTPVYAGTIPNPSGVASLRVDDFDCQIEPTFIVHLADGGVYSSEEAEKDGKFVRCYSGGRECAGIGVQANRLSETLRCSPQPNAIWNVVFDAGLRLDGSLTGLSASLYAGTSTHLGDVPLSVVLDNEGLGGRSSADDVHHWRGTGRVATAELPEAMVRVLARAEKADGSYDSVESDPRASIIVDRTLPQFALASPAPGAQFCPVREVMPDGTVSRRYDFNGFLTDDWLEDADVEVTRVTDGSKIVVPIHGFGFRSRAVLQGTLASMPADWVMPGAYEMSGMASDASGGSVCLAPRKFIVSDEARVEGLSASAAAFSPNGDGTSDSVTLAYHLDGPAQVQVTASVGGVAHLLAKSLQVGAGYQQWTWSGVASDGSELPDGDYLVEVSATDACGAGSSQTVAVRLDTTPPVARIDAPVAQATVGALFEVRGEATDRNFETYEVLIGAGTSPASFTSLATSNVASRGLLGAVNSADLQAGDYTVRLVARDTVGLKSEASVVVRVQAGQLLSGFGVSPGIISPNGDGRRDTAAGTVTLLRDAEVEVNLVRDGMAPRTLLGPVALAAGTHPVALSNEALQAAAAAFEGDYSVEVVARAGEVSESARTSLVLDVTAPTLGFSAPSAGGFVPGRVQVAGQVQDAHLAFWTLSKPGALGDLEVAQDSEARDGALALLEGLAEGPQRLVLTAEDVAGNRRRLQVDFESDTTAPQVAFINPLSGVHLSKTLDPVAVSASLVEQHLDEVRLELERGGVPARALFRTSAAPSPVTTAWSAGGEDDGPANLVWTAVDKAGNTGVARIPVVVDNTPPVARIDAPRDGYLKLPGRFVGTASDTNIGVWTLEVASGPPGGAQYFTEVARGSTSVSGGQLLALPLLPADGTYTARLHVKDRAGNEAEDVAAFVVDTQPPAAPLNLIATLQRPRAVTLNWTASTDPDLAGYRVYRARGSGGFLPLGGELVTATSMADTLPSDGTFRYVVTAVDEAGLESARSNEQQVAADSQPPVAAISNPSAGAVVSGVLEVIGTAYASDDFREYRLARGEGTAPASPTIFARSPAPVSNAPLGVVDTRTLAEGSVHTLLLEAEDLSGNVATAKVTFSVDNRPPVRPTLVSAVLNGADVDVTWKALAEPDLAGYLLFRNGRLVNAPPGATLDNLTPYLLPPSSTVYKDLAVPDGDLTWELQAVDKAGNLSERSNPVSLRLERRAPVATITSPASMSRLDGTVTVAAEVLDQDVATVQFEVRSGADASFRPLGPALKGFPFVAQLDTQTLGSPAIEVRAVATDRSGKADPTPVSAYYFRDSTPQAPSVRVRVLERSPTVRWANPNPSGAIAGYQLNRDGAPLDNAPRARVPGVATASSVGVGTAQGVYDSCSTYLCWESAGGAPQRWEVQLSQPTVLREIFTDPSRSATWTVSVRVRGLWVPLLRNKAAGYYAIPIDPLLEVEAVRIDFLTSPEGRVGLNRVYLSPMPLTAASPYADSSGLFGSDEYSVTAVTPFGLKASGSAVATAYAPYISVQSNTVYVPEVGLTGGGAPPDSTVEVFRDDVVVAETVATPSGTFACDVPLVPDLNRLRVRARYDVDSVSAFSSSAYVTYRAPPAVALTLALTSQEGASAKFAFDVTGDTTNVVGYRVTRESAGTETTLANLLPSERTFSDSGMRDGSYRYRVVAYTAQNTQSAPSNAVQVDVATPPLPAPDQLWVAVPEEGGQLDVQWSSVPGAVAYALERGLSPQGPFTLVASAVSAVRYIDAGLENSVTYYYRAFALDERGNPGASSPVGSGTPLEHVPPAAPVILLPTTAVNPIEVATATADVSGTSEPGARVELFANGALIGTAPTGPAEVKQSDVPLIHTGATARSVSPSGRYVAYLFRPEGQSDYSIAVEDRVGDQVRVLPNPGIQSNGAPLVTADGTRVLMPGYRKADWTAVVFIGDVVAGTWSELALPRPNYSWNFVWSPDGKRLAYLTYSESWNYEVATYALDTGVEQRLWSASSAQPTHLDWLANERLVFVVDRWSGNPDEVQEWTLGDVPSQRVLFSAPSMDTDVLAVSPATNQLLVAGGQGYGSWAMHLVDATSATSRQLTPAQGWPEGPAFAPDAKRVAFIYNSTLTIADLVAGAVEPMGYLYAESLLWAEDGLLSVSSWSLRSITWGAPFYFDDVPLQMGTNRLVAYARDASGNRSVGSAPVEVVRDVRKLPDLVVSASLQPAVPTPDKPANAYVTVRNAGGGNASDVAVSVMVLGNDGSVRTVPDVVFTGALAPTEARTALVPLNLTGLTGEQYLVVVADPEHHVEERDRDNNEVTLPFLISTSTDLVSGLALSPSQVRVGETSTATVTLINPGAARDVDVELSLRGPTGTLVRTLGAAQAFHPLGAGSRVSFTRDVDPAGLLAGTYQVVARVTSGAEVLGTAPAALVYVPDTSAAVALEASRAQYGPGESVGLTMQVTNRSDNLLLTDATLQSEVTGPDGAPVDVRSVPVPQLGLGATHSHSMSLEGPLAPGRYVARVVLSRDGLPTASAATIFEVEGRPLLVGEVSPVGATGEPPAFASGSVGALRLAVANGGTSVAEALELRLRVVEPASLAVVREVSLPVGALAAGGNWTHLVPVETTGLALQVYAASLTARWAGQGDEVTLGSTRFRVADASPPRIVSTNLTDGMFVRGVVTLEARVVDDSAGVRSVGALVDGVAESALVLTAGSALDGVWGGSLVLGADGAHVLTVFAADADGNDGRARASAANPVAVRLVSDTIRPVIAIRGVTDGMLSGEAVIPQVEVTDVNLAESTVTLDGVPFVSGTQVAADGEHLLEVRARDRADNRSSALVRFTIDGSAPRITVTGVYEGQLAQGPLTPRVYVADSNLESQSVLLDGASFTSGTPVAGEGGHLLQVEARDATGHIARASVAFTLDRTPPVITVTGVREGQLSRTPLAPMFSATDAHLLSAEATLDGAYFATGTPVAEDGVHLLRIVALDQAGNSATTEVAFVVDGTPPDLAIDGIDEDGVSAGPVTPLIRATDADLDTVWATLNEVPYLPGESVAAEGDYVLRAFARDHAGNQAELTRAFAIDRTRPSVMLGGFTDGECRAGDVTVEFSARDAYLRSVEGRLDSAVVSSGTVVRTEGTHTVVVRATDLADGETTSTGRFTIDHTAPLIEVGGVEEGWYYASPVSATVAFTDANLASSSVSLDGAPYAPGTSISVEGTHTLVVTASDCAGNPARVSRTFTLDTTPPVIAVEGVIDGSVYATAVTPQVRITEENLAQSTTTLDGVPYVPGSAVTAEGEHLLVVRASDLAGHQAALELHFSLQRSQVDVGKRSDATYARVLALLRSGTCAMEPSEVERLTAFFKQQVEQVGGSFQVTTTEAAFQAELRTGVFNVFLLVSQGSASAMCDEDRPAGGSEARLRNAVAQAVTERVYAGSAGLLVIRTRPADSPDYREVLGIDLYGQVADVQVASFKEPLAPLETLTPETTSVRLKLGAARALASYFVSAQGDAAAAAYSYGVGRSLTLGFDPSRTRSATSASAGATAFARALAWVVPPVEAAAPLGVAPVELRVGGSAAGEALQVKEQLAPGLEALQSLPAATVSADGLGLEWSLPTAAAGETRTLRYLARLPDVVGSYVTYTEVTALTATGSRLLTSRTLTLEVSEDGAQLLAAAFDTVRALPLGGRDGAVRARLERLLIQVQQRAVVDAAGAEANLEALYAAVDEAKALRSVSPVQTRLAVDQLIRYWEARWSAL